MTRREPLFAAGWVIAGLVALHMVLGAQPQESRPLVAAIRASCELPAGTVVFVVRHAAEETP